MSYQSEKQQLAAPLTGYGDAESGGIKAQQTSSGHSANQKSGVRDPIFLLLFVGHIIAMCYIAFTSGIDAVKSWGDDASTDDTNFSYDSKMLSSTIGLCVVAAAFGGIVVTFLMNNAESLIQTSLRLNIAISALCALVCFANGIAIGGILFMVMTLINWCYYRAVQNRIPFAAANLKVACQAVREHFSVLLVSYITIIKSTIWLCIWTLAFAAAYNNYATTTTDVDGDSETTVSDSFGTVCFFLLLSLYWTQEVLKNVTHVTTAGVVASWWYDPSRSSVVSGAYCRATTTSLGSIAMGSFFVAILQVLEDMARNARRENNALACIAECILSCLRGMLEYFNRWAFVYVGIYGDSFVSSGRAVMALFKNRGWTALINDNLIQRVLMFMALGVGGLMAGVGALIPVITGSWLNSTDNASGILAIVGFIVGFLLTLILVGVIDSAVATVFVCMAEAPNVLESTHPALFYDLTAAWREFHNIHF
mmetsp:Transcript_23293/g.48434  ORF Transcript_23293/g.48434 Transcript_23293/m.48434 type:complete len:480 (+) Transcript_23293:1357-2796(+)